MEIIYTGWAVGIGIALLIWYYTKWLPNSLLKERFGKLGNMAGMTKDDIERKVGKPKAYQYFDGGVLQCTWSAGRYAVTLQFDKDGICTNLIAEVNA